MREKILRVLLVTLLVSLLSGCGNTVTDDNINQLVVERATVESIVPKKEVVSDSTIKECVVESEAPSIEETESVEEIDTHTHVFEEQVIKEASCIEYGTEELICECGYSFTQEIPMEPHIAGDWVVVEAATYDKDGMKAQFCIGCNSVLATEPIAKVICEHDYKIVESVSATCTKKGNTTYKCNVCNASYSVEQGSKGHNFDETRTVEATCTQKGAVYKICKNCNHEEQTATLDFKAHDYIVNPNKEAIEATCTEAGHNYYICSVCGDEKEETITKEHNWDNGVITAEPTCVSSGTKTYTCGNCQDTKTEEIEVLEHDYVEAERKGTACEEVIIYRCSRENCGNEKQTAVNSQAHISDDERIIMEATCTTEGKKIKVCSVCGVDVGEEIVISAIGHDYGDWQIVKEPTCQTEGSKEKSCDNCLDVQTEVISMLEHTEDEWKVEKTASCTEEGLKVLRCKECDTILDTLSIAKVAHFYTELVEMKEATCIENGYELYKCDSCNETEKQNIPATGHTAGEEIITPATDLAEGSKKQYCTECNALLKDEVIEKLPHIHDYAEEIERQEATCSTEGYVIYKCACGDTKQETTETTEHDEGTWEVIVEATYTTEGTKEKHCSVCGELLETETIPTLDLGIDSIYYVTLRDGTQEAVIGHYDREAAAEMLVLVNQYRVENGFGELTIHDGFQEAADHRGYESAHTWEHTRPSGGKASIYYGYWGENLATGSNDAELVLEAWQNSEGHNNNILYDYLGTGIGYDYTGLSCFCKRTDYGYEYYWVQVFH